MNWVYGTTQPFPLDDFGAGLKQKGYHLDVHSVCMSLQLWRSTHALIGKHNGNPLPPCKYIVPTGIAYWNKTEGFVDVMSRLISHIKIPFKPSGPVLQLFFRLFGNMVINGHLTTNFLRLSDDTFDQDKYSYDDIKKKMSNETSLNEYVKVLDSSF